MFDQMTDRVWLCLEHARQEAQRLKHSAVLPEHLLLGMLKVDGGLAADVFRQCHVDVDVLRDELYGALGRAESSPKATEKAPEWSTESRKVLQTALEEAMALGQGYVATEHLLLGLLRDVESPAAEVLSRHRVRWDSARGMIRGASTPPRPAAPAKPDEGSKSGPELCQKCGRAAARFIRIGSAGESEAQAGTRLCPECTRRELPEAPAHPQASLEEKILRQVTERVRRCLENAEAEARQFHHDFIGTEHILLGLLKDDRGVACSVLKKMGIALGRVQEEVEKHMPPSGTASPAELRYSTRAMRVIHWAARESQEMERDDVGTEHLLLGILREADGLAAQCLTRLGAEYDSVRREIHIVLGLTSPWESSPATEPASSHHPPPKARRRGSPQPPPPAPPSPEEAATADEPPSGTRVKSSYSEEATNVLSRIMELEEQKQEAIEKEDFERAGRLRDEALALSRHVEQALKGSHQVTYVFDDRTTRNVLELMEQYMKMRSTGADETRILDWLKSSFFKLPSYAIARKPAKRQGTKADPAQADEAPGEEG